ncbi:MAG: cell division ATPase MinD [Candidatus Aenigmarchaeota archaeon]|nr:cell division ATPase MinD [Candidatus Aenigmarchaeota archaeon]
MGRVICVGSAKGGVGKTTLTANLSLALTEMGYSVIVIDANLTTSNLSIHFGIPTYPTGVQDIMKGKAKIDDVIYEHPTGLKIIPADISLDKIMVPKTRQFVNIFYSLIDNADFILIDSAAGLGRESLSAVEAADELLIVTNPELPAITDALKLARMAEKCGTANLGVVVNRIKGKKHEIPIEGISEFIDLPVIGIVPEDETVRKAISFRQPIILFNRGSPAAQQFIGIASNLLGEDYSPSFSIRGFFSDILNRF